jgi:penicillin-binding protein 1B
MPTCQLERITRPSRGQGPHTVSACPRPPPWKTILLGAGLLILLTSAGVFIHFYLQLARIIDARLAGNVFDNPSVVLAAPTELQVGQHLTAGAVAAHLRKACYTEGREGRGVGSYTLTGNRLEIQPGPESFFRNGEMSQDPAKLEFRSDRLVSITALDDKTALKTYLLEPEVITNLFGEGRTKRRLVRYQALPRVVVDAILATEDHRFYSHHGVDSLRIVSAAIGDLRAHERMQGGSTLTMQLARNLFLTPSRTIWRKVEEVFFALLLELRLTKEQILELYANQVYLGQRDSFSIYGFGEAAVAYFNKDISALTLPEAALLAGLIRGPNFYLPYQHPERAAERRNFVLQRMRATGFISGSEAEPASQTPLGLAEQSAEARQEAYFVDLVKIQLLAQFSEHDLLSRGYRVYTTLNLDLQRAASEGARAGLIEVDREVKKQRGRQKMFPLESSNQPQLALIVLDPHTGDVKALVGGRGYGASQLNHVLARRQPGSSFKPFVYAAALNSGVDGSQPLVTLATVLEDEPTTFEFGSNPYAPKNYKQAYRGSVTVREALTHSLNVPTVRLAEMVGYRKVRDFAVAAGFNNQLSPTPAIALGAYVATPLEIAGAYTTFANGGEYVGPRCIVAVTDAVGGTVWNNPVRTHRVLDARVSYLMVSLLEGVINSGTGAGVRTRGFTLPAAGKTGTSHDGWFAGFTSNLLAVVWVGYDDDRQLGIPGAQSALPLWTEFMKRTTGLPTQRNLLAFSQPPGIVTAAIDNLTNLVARADPTVTHSEVFIEGTEPFPPIQVAPPEVALGMPGQDASTLPDEPSPPRPDGIVLTTDTQGRRIYINASATVSRGPDNPLRPLLSFIPLSAPVRENGAAPAAAVRGQVSLSEGATPAH